MDLKKALFKDRSKAYLIDLSKKVGNDQGIFDQLWLLMFEKDHDTSFRSAYLMEFCTEHNPTLLDKYMPNIAKEAKHIRSPSVKRHFGKVLSNKTIPDKETMKMLDICYQWILSPDDPVAVKVHAMQIAFNIVLKKDNELKEEFIQTLKLCIELTPTAGIYSRANKLMKKLRK